MARLLSDNPATAYFCGDDVLSVGALSAVQAAGMHVPNDIGIIGLNDMELSGWDNINLTTIRQPIDKIVHASVEQIVNMMEGDAGAPQARLFPCSVVDRGTLRERR